MTQQEKQERLNTLTTEKMNLESSLKSGDYKVIKCAEAQAAGVEMPYDIEALHQERQQQRDRINAIEEEVRKTEAIEPDEDMPDDMHPEDIAS